MDLGSVAGAAMIDGRFILCDKCISVNEPKVRRALAVAQWLASWAPLDPGSVPAAAMLDGSFILATSAIHLITVISACLLGLT